MTCPVRCPCRVCRCEEGIGRVDESFAGKMNRQGLNKTHDMGAPRPGPIKGQARWKPNRVDPGSGTKESKGHGLRPVPRDACPCTIVLFVTLAECRPREGMFGFGR